MSKKPALKTKLPITDAERHKRFVEVARKIGASEDISDFDRAFDAVTQPHKKKSNGVSK